MKAFDLAAANNFSVDEELKVIAFFGPSASGKSTFIKMLLERYPDRAGRIRIYLTRTPRRGESATERNCLSEESYHEKVMRAELCFISQMYGFWVGADRKELQALAATGKVIVIDPNNFERLRMLRELFPRADILTLNFVPKPMDVLRRLSGDETRRIFVERIENREKIPEDEFVLRVDECVETMKQMCQMELDHLIVNDFSSSVEDLFAVVENYCRPFLDI